MYLWNVFQNVISLVFLKDNIRKDLKVYFNYIIFAALRKWNEIKKLILNYESCVCLCVCGVRVGSDLYEVSFRSTSSINSVNIDVDLNVVTVSGQRNTCLQKFIKFGLYQI